MSTQLFTPTPLTTLIQAMEQHSLGSLRMRTRLSKSNLSKMRRGEIKTFPTPRTIRRLARALDLTERDVVLGLAEILDLKV